MMCRKVLYCFPRSKVKFVAYLVEKPFRKDRDGTVSSRNLVRLIIMMRERILLLPKVKVIASLSRKPFGVT
jgi:hypothetical protein